MPSSFDHVRVVLVRPRNPLNIGAVARAMSNFGFRSLRLVAPWEPSFLDARSAVGASQVLLDAQVFDCVAEAVADCALVVGTTAASRRELQHPLYTLQEGAEMIGRQLPLAPVALLFGSEKTGLSNQELAHCHWLLRIPTRDEHASMNLGQAVAVCLYEFVRSGAQANTIVEHGNGPPAASAEVERITQLLFESLAASGYVHSGGEGATLEKLRRMIRRMQLSEEDAEVWMGMLRKILWKLKHTDEHSKET